MNRITERLNQLEEAEHSYEDEKRDIHNTELLNSVDQCSSKDQNERGFWTDKDVVDLIRRFLADVLLCLKENNYGNQDYRFNKQGPEAMEKELTTLATLFMMGEVT